MTPRPLSPPPLLNERTFWMTPFKENFENIEIYFD